MQSTTKVMLVTGMWLLQLCGVAAFCLEAWIWTFKGESACVISGPDLSKYSCYLEATWCSPWDMRMVRRGVSTLPGDTGRWICPWLLVILKCSEGWGVAPSFAHGPRALRGLSCPKTWLCPQAEWLCQGQHIPPGAMLGCFSWNPALRNNLSPNERQAVVFLGHCLLSLLFSLPCSSLCTFLCPWPSPIISKEQELGFGLNMNIKSQCSVLWNPTYINTDAAGVWQCSVMPLVIFSQQTAVKNLSQLESFMCLSFTFWIFCCDWSYCNFLLSRALWGEICATPHQKTMMIQSIYFAFPW